MTNPIGAIFGRSPIQPLQGHMAQIQGCVGGLSKFLGASMQQDWAAAEQHHQEVLSAKQAADSIKREIRNHLPRSLLLPIARSDLLELLRIQDDIGFRCKQIAEMVLLRKLVVPAALSSGFAAYAEATLNLTKLAQKTINELDELLETGFEGREAELVEALVQQLEDMEQQSESGQWQLLSQLVAQEESLPPVEAIFLHKLVDSIGDIAHLARKAGSRLLMFMSN